MADRVLLFRTHFGKGLAEGIEPEEGIVSEAAGSYGVEEDLAGAVAGADYRLTRERLSFGNDAGDRADERRASVADSFEIFEKLFVILPIIARLTCISCGIYSGGAVKRVYNKSRVVRDSAKSRKFRSRACLDKLKNI